MLNQENLGIGTVKWVISGRSVNRIFLWLYLHLCLTTFKVHSWCSSRAVTKGLLVEGRSLKLGTYCLIIVIDIKHVHNITCWCNLYWKDIVQTDLPSFQSSHVARMHSSLIAFLKKKSEEAFNTFRLLRFRRQWTQAGFYGVILWCVSYRGDWKLFGSACYAHTYLGIHKQVISAW